MSVLPRLLKGFIQPPFWANEHLEDIGAPFYSYPTNSDRETIDRDFAGYVSGALKSNGVVFAAIVARMTAFSQARFGWRNYVNGRPTDLFYDDRLSVVERPWKGATTSDLLARMEVNASLAGNFYGAIVGPEGNRRVRVLRPDFVSIVTGSPSNDPFDVEAEIVAYVYKPPAASGKAREELLLTPDKVIHYAPIPDPEAQWRGMSWLTPVVTEIAADKAATRHKLKFFENGAVPGLVMSYDPKLSPAQFKEAVAKFVETHEGLDKAYKTLHVGGGADPKVVGANLQQMDFKVTQGAGENRIAIASRVPAVILGISEGLAGSSLNAGNYGSSRRSFADLTIAPLWTMAASSIQRVLNVPDGAHLWPDTREIPFLREDAKQAAEIQQFEAQTIRSLVDAGFTHASVLAALNASDWNLLEHSGLYSVQLQPPNTTAGASVE